METGTIIGHIDVAEALVFIFFAFFFGLILHLRTEDKREGYPLVDPAGGSDGEGFPPMPAPKTFLLRQGGVVTAPHLEAERPLEATRAFPFPGSSLDPTGDPLVDGVGPAAYAMRRTEPLWYADGVPQLCPLRAMDGAALAKGDVDPRGMRVIDIHGEVAGVVRDLWLDRGSKIVRYLEVGADGGAHVLLPIFHTDIRGLEQRVSLKAVRAADVVRAPRLAQPDVVTAREEDQINAFYAGAHFFTREGPRSPPRLAPWERGDRRARRPA